MEQLNRAAIEKFIGTVQKPTERQQFGAFIHRVIRQFELSPNIAVRFADIADCDKRRQSDLYNILNACEVFNHISDKLITWRGFGATTAALVRLGVHNERASHNQPMLSLFAVGQSPSLNSLVKTFLSFYVFLGVDSINIQEVSVAMAENPDQAKKILRRLYLIVFVLEQAGLLEHGYEHSNYILKQPLDIIITAVFQESLRLRMFPEGSVESLLKKLDRVYITTLHQRRREYYQIAIKRFDPPPITAQDANSNAK